MEETYFDEIRRKLYTEDQDVKAGKMMSSEAIVYKNQVFAFLSRQQKMVFKLGKEFELTSHDAEILVFNPFRNRKPLSGWFEVSFKDRVHWEALAREALEQMKK